MMGIYLDGIRKIDLFSCIFIKSLQMSVIVFWRILATSSSFSFATSLYSEYRLIVKKCHDIASNYAFDSQSDGIPLPGMRSFVKSRDVIMITGSIHRAVLHNIILITENIIFSRKELYEFVWSEPLLTLFKKVVYLSQNFTVILNT
jgi:hypothetical protein